MKSQAIGNRIQSSNFDMGSARKCFTAEISMLSHQGLNPTDQLYYDADDQGFVMVSSKTQNEAEFFLYHTEREADNDIRAWLFKPTEFTLQRHKQLAGISVIIYNT